MYMCRGPQGPRGLKFRRHWWLPAEYLGRGPQGPRGLKFYGLGHQGPCGLVAVRKDRED